VCGLHLGPAGRRCRPCPETSLCSRKEKTPTLRRIADPQLAVFAPRRPQHLPRFGPARRSPSCRNCRGTQLRSIRRVGIRDPCGHYWRRLYRPGTGLRQQLPRNVAVTMLEREPEIMMRLMPGAARPAPSVASPRRIGVEVRRDAEHPRNHRRRGGKLGVVTERDTIEV